MNTYNTFSHVKLGEGYATLAIRETTYDDGKPTTLELGVSWCSPNDHFSRPKGRLVATGRLNSKRGYYHSVPRAPDVKLKAQADSVINKLLVDKNVWDRFPDWVMAMGAPVIG